MLRLLYRDDRPHVPACDQHRIRQEAAQPAIAVHVGVDVDKEEMPQDGTNPWMLLCRNQLKKNRHAFAYRLFRERYVFRATNVDLVIAPSSQITGL